MYNIVPISGLSAITPISTVDTVAKQDKKDTVTFGEILAGKIEDVKALEAQSLKSATDIATGASNDIESAMLDSTKASTAIEMTVQLVTRAVNAYKDILSMQI